MGDREHDALALAVNGFEVFPVKPGEKSPPLVKFSLEATGDPEAVAEYGRGEILRARLAVAAGDGDDFQA